jgi:hypothetical protein
MKGRILELMVILSYVECPPTRLAVPLTEAAAPVPLGITSSLGKISSTQHSSEMRQLDNRNAA